VDDGSDVYYDGAEDVGAYCTAKLTFSKIFTSKFGVRIIQVCVLYSNFYGSSKPKARIKNFGNNRSKRTSKLYAVSRKN